MLFTEYFHEFELATINTRQRLELGEPYINQLPPGARWSLDDTFLRMQPHERQAALKKQKQASFKTHISNRCHAILNDTVASEGHRVYQYVNMLAQAADVQFVERRRPTIKVYPDYLLMFASAELNFKLRELVLPFPVVAVVFPKDNTFAQLLPSGSRVPTAARLNIFDTGTREILKFRDYESFCKETESCFITDLVDVDPAEKLPIAMFEVLFDGSYVFGDRVVWAEDGSLDNLYYVTANRMTVAVNVDGDKPLDQLVARFPIGVGQKAFSAVKTNQELFQYGSVLAARALVCAVSMAVNREEAVETDIREINYLAYRNAKDEGNSEVVAKLEDDEKVYRKRVGLTIGRRDYVLGRRSYNVDTTTSTDSEGRQLKYRHTRRAHFRRVRFGPGRQQFYRKLIKMVEVRPDLPVNPNVSLRFYSTGRSTKKKQQETACEHSQDQD